MMLRTSQRSLALTPRRHGESQPTSQPLVPHPFSTLPRPSATIPNLYSKNSSFQIDGSSGARWYARKAKSEANKDSFATLVKDKIEEEIDSGRLWWIAPVLASILLGLTAFYVSELWPIKKKEGEELDEGGEVDVIVSELVSIGLQLTLRRYSVGKMEKELIPKLSELCEHEDIEVCGWAMDLLAVIAHRSKELSEKALKHVEVEELTKRAKKVHVDSKEGQDKKQRRFLRSYFELLAVAPRSLSNEAIESGAAEVLVDMIEAGVMLPRYRTLKFRAERSLYISLLARWIDNEEVRELVEKRGLDKVFSNDLRSLSWLSLSIWTDRLSFNSLDSAIYEPLGRILKTLHHHGGHSKKSHDEGGGGGEDGHKEEKSHAKDSHGEENAKEKTEHTEEKEHKEKKKEYKEEKKHEEEESFDPISKAIKRIGKREHRSLIPLTFQKAQERRHTRHEYLRGLAPFVLYSNIPVALTLVLVPGNAFVVVTTPIAALWTTFLLLPGNGLKTYYLRDARRRKPLFSFRKPEKPAKSEASAKPSKGKEEKGHHEEQGHGEKHAEGAKHAEDKSHKTPEKEQPATKEAPHEKEVKEEHAKEEHAKHH